MQTGTTKQTELIDIHKRMRKEQEFCEQAGLRAHYEHLLLALRKSILRGNVPQRGCKVYTRSGWGFENGNPPGKGHLPWKVCCDRLTFSSSF